MKKSEAKQWREQTAERFELGNADRRLTIKLLHIYENDSPNASIKGYLTYTGDCEASDGTFVKKKKRYELTGKAATEILEAIRKLSPFEGDKLPKLRRERYHELENGFALSLSQTNEGSFYFLTHRNDGWRFKVEKPGDFFEALTIVARL